MTDSDFKRQMRREALQAVAMILAAVVAIAALAELVTSLVPVLARQIDVVVRFDQPLTIRIENKR
jgi:hypothetical protein